MNIKSCCEILNIQPESTLEEIKRQVRKLLLQYHPDVNLNNKDFFEEKTKKILFAYETLVEIKSKEDDINKNVRTAEEEYQVSKNNKSIITFKIDGKLHSIFIDSVKEVCRLKDIKIKQIIDGERIAGWIFWREKIIPLLKLENNINLEENIEESKKEIIIIVNNSKFAGLLVDKVEGIVPIPPGFMQNITTYRDDTYLFGEWKRDGEIFYILNINKIFS